VICGQALSHCVNYTVRDIVSQWSSSTNADDNNNSISNHNRNITILKDCMSSVPGFEEVGMTFLQDMMELGVNVETSDTFVP
jgi:nicotinamidase/pyrazinamidase